MARNLILEELHRARKEILDEFKGDTAAYLRDAQARLEASGRPIARRQQRTIRCAGTVQSGISATADQSPPSQ